KRGVASDRFFVEGYCFAKCGWIPTELGIATTKIKSVNDRISAASRRARGFIVHRWLLSLTPCVKLQRHCLRDVALERRQFGRLPLVALCPEVPIRQRVHQLGVDHHPIPSADNAS